jgi:CarD family transcriptional regulator
MEGANGQTEGVKCRKRRFFGQFSLIRDSPWVILIGAVSRHETGPTKPSFNGGNVTFQVGDKVIYPNHGLGIVERIEDKTILGTTCGFFHLRIVSNDTTVLVPVANVDNVGLRKAISDEEVDRLFALLSDGKIDNHQNWKGRFKDNSDKMRTGSIYDMADVLKSLTFLSKSKSLSFREKRMLDRARALIVSEVSEVMREKIMEIELRVDRALEKCFMVKVRTMTRQAARAKIARPVKAVVMQARRTARAS